MLAAVISSQARAAFHHTYSGQPEDPESQEQKGAVGTIACLTTLLRLTADRVDQLHGKKACQQFIAYCMPVVEELTILTEMAMNQEFTFTFYNALERVGATLIPFLNEIETRMFTNNGTLEEETAQAS